MDKVYIDEIINSIIEEVTIAKLKLNVSNK